jgi:hypothetical protein
MYGLINKAVRALIVSHYGEATWLEIVKLAGCQALFISNTSYPDETTYGAPSLLHLLLPFKHFLVVKQQRLHLSHCSRFWHHCRKLSQAPVVFAFVLSLPFRASFSFSLLIYFLLIYLFLRTDAAFFPSVGGCCERGVEGAGA